MEVEAAAEVAEVVVLLGVNPEAGGADAKSRMQPSPHLCKMVVTLLLIITLTHVTDGYHGCRPKQCPDVKFLTAQPVALQVVGLARFFTVCEPCGKSAGYDISLFDAQGEAHTLDTLSSKFALERLA